MPDSGCKIIIMKDSFVKTRLQVLVATYGNGILNITPEAYPPTPGVQFLVSWQKSDGITLPDYLIREDLTIIKTPTTGLSANRNNALRAASAPLLLIADDDLHYTSENFLFIIESFDKNPSADIITFQYSDSQTPSRSYPNHSFNLAVPPKGYYISSIEIALRRESLLDMNGELIASFDNRFGVGGTFPAGEENIFINDLISAGLNGVFIPHTIVSHDHPSTSERLGDSDEFIAGKGAMMTLIHPHSWFLRMIAHAVRASKHEKHSFIKYCRLWLNGVFSLNGSKSRFQRLLTPLIYLLGFIIYALISSMVPLQLDDWVFRTGYLDATEGNQAISLTGIAEYFSAGAVNDNIRLSNMFGILFSTSLPRFLFPIFNALVIIGSMRLILSLSNGTGKEHSPSLLIWIWGMMIAFLPWRNSLFVLTYSLNYIWSGFFALLFLYLILRYLRRTSKFNLLLLLISAFPAALFHEGFAIPLAGGLWGYSLISLLNKKTLPCGWWFTLSLFSIMGFLPLMTPALLNRGTSEISTYRINPSLLIDYILPLLLVSYFAVRIAIPKFRNQTISFIKSEIVIIPLITMILAGSLSLVFNHTPRMSYLSNLMAIIIIAYSIRHIQKHKGYKLITIAIFIGIVVQSAATITYQHRLLKEHREIISLILKSKHGSIFYDNLQPQDCPRITLYMPVRSEWTTPYSFRAFKEGMKYIPGMENKTFPAIIPANLHSAPIGSYPEGVIAPMKIAPESNEGLYEIIDLKGKNEVIYAISLPYINEKGDSLTFLKLKDFNPLYVRMAVGKCQ